MFKMCKDVELSMMDIIMTSDLNLVGQLNDMSNLLSQSEDELCLCPFE